MYLKRHSLQKDAELEAVTYGSDLIFRFDRELNTLINLSSGIAAYITIHQGELDSVEFLRLLHEIHGNSLLLRNIGVAEGTLLKYLEPLKGNEEALGIDYRGLSGQWPDIESAIKLKKGTLAGPLELLQGGQALILSASHFF